MWRRALLASIFSCCVWADKPVLDAIYPAGAGIGTTNEVTLLGKFADWPVQIWNSGTGLAFEVETNKGKVRVTVATSAAPQVQWVRVYNGDGASDPRMFVIGGQAEIQETEPNNHFRKAQKLEGFPVVLNGRLEKNEDVDCYAIPLKTGEWLDAALDAYTLMGKVDGVLRLLSEDGYELDWNHDFGTLDPRLIWRSPKDQTVILQVFGFVYPADASIRLTGGSGGVYRLRVSVQPEAPLDGVAKTCAASGGGTNHLALGESIRGVVSSGGNPYRLKLRKDQWVELRAAAAAIGSPLDPWVSIQNEAGKELGRADDAEGSRDARLEWKAPEDGDYVVTVGSVTHHLRSDFCYELSARELQPDYRVTLDAHEFTLEPGGTNEVKVSVKRLRGFTNELSLRFADLPEGVSGEPKADAKGGDLSLALIARTNAPPFSGVFHVTAKDAMTSAERRVPFDFTTRSVNNGVPGGYSKLQLETLDEPWLTVTAPVKGKEKEKRD